MSDLLGQVKQAIVEGDDELAQAKTGAALAEGIAPLQLLNGAIVPGIEEAGRLWNDNLYFLPDIILSAHAFRSALDVVEPFVKGETGSRAGRILLGVVQGDVHDLGKIIVVALLSGAGFEVIDLGVDVPVQVFVDKALELKPDIVGLGAYMSTTMLLLKNVIDGLKAKGVPARVIVGGVPTSQALADKIGADAWGQDALDAVAKARQLVEDR